MISRTVLGRSTAISIVEITAAEAVTLTGDGTDHALDFTLKELTALMYGVKYFTISSTADIKDWWNGTQDGVIPAKARGLPLVGGVRKLPNNNVFSLPDNVTAGTFIYPWGSGATTTPYFTTQDKYVLATDVSGVSHPITTGLLGDTSTSNVLGTGVGLSLNTIYYVRATGKYYPGILIRGAFSTLTGGVAAGTLTLMGKTTTIYNIVAGAYSGNITITVSDEW